MLELLKRARRRLFLAAYVRVAAWLVVAVVVLAGLAVLSGWAAAFESSPVLLIIVPAVLVGIGLVAAGLIAWRLTPGPLVTARKLEHHFGLDERLSTSLELGDRDDALARSLRGDAELRSRDLSLAGFASPRPTMVQLWSLLGSVAALVVLLLAPLPSATVRLTAAAAPQPEEGDDAAAVEREFISLIADRAQQAAPANEQPPVVRNNARPNTPQRRSGAASPTPSLPSTSATSAAVSVSEPASLERSKGEAGEAVLPTSARLGEAPSQPPNEAVAAPTVRNDGSTNPSYDQAAARDQELREHARRREAASSPGGGSGEPVAMIDAAVAGDATAGFEGGEGQVLPDGPAAVDELSMSNITDPSGRRVRVERLPDELEAPGSDYVLDLVEFSEGDEPLVSREASATSADLELLRRYRSPTTNPLEAP